MNFFMVSNTNTGLIGQYILFDFMFIILGIMNLIYCDEPDILLII